MGDVVVVALPVLVYYRLATSAAHLGQTVGMVDEPLYLLVQVIVIARFEAESVHAVLNGIVSSSKVGHDARHATAQGLKDHHAVSLA